MTSRAKRGVAVAMVVILGSLPAYSLLAPEGCACERPSTVMKSSLRNLVPAEEQYFSERRTYTASLDSLQYPPEGRTVIAIIEAGPEGWSANATYPGTKGACSVFVGRPQHSIAGATQGEVRCTRIRALLFGRW